MALSRIQRALVTAAVVGAGVMLAGFLGLVVEWLLMSVHLIPFGPPSIVAVIAFGGGACLTVPSTFVFFVTGLLE